LEARRREPRRPLGAGAPATDPAGSRGLRDPSRERGSHVYLLTLPSLYLSGERPEPEALAIGRLPRFTDNPYTLAAVISRYNQLLRETADQEGVELIDLASWARETLKPRHHYFASTLALNEAGQLQMGRRIASRLSRALAEREPD
jgi:hypothetical protein